MARLTPLPPLDEPHVSLPVAALVEAVEAVERICDELLVGIAAAKGRLWAGNRGAAIGELDRLAHRVDHVVRERFAALLAGEGEKPNQPRRAA